MCATNVFQTRVNVPESHLRLELLLKFAKEETSKGMRDGEKTTAELLQGAPHEINLNLPFLERCEGRIGALGAQRGDFTSSSTQDGFLYNPVHP